VKGAVEALERFCKGRHGTVEGRVLLAQALDRGGRDADAALMRDEAWKEYVSAPGFQRRRERLWAWRARPSRPLTYALVAALVLGVGAWTASRLRPPAGASEYEYPDTAGMDASVDE
jgi:hypothetical protein